MPEATARGRRATVPTRYVRLALHSRAVEPRNHQSQITNHKSPITNHKSVLMPHIALPPDLPGIVSGFAFRPETAKPMRELAEILLRGPNTLTSAERETIAAFVSSRNDCYFCQASHTAAAAHHQQGDYSVVDAVKRDYESAPVSSKL